MTKTIEILAALAEDVTQSVDKLSAQEIASIAKLKAKAASMNPIMAIVGPTDPSDTIQTMEQRKIM